MTQPLHYDPVAGVFYRTFNVRFQAGGVTFEIPLKATCWQQAESILAAIRHNGYVHNELVEVVG